jgi:hypothetical protein
MAFKGRKPQAPSGIIIDLKEVNGVWQIKTNDSNGEDYKDRKSGFFTSMHEKGEKTQCCLTTFDFKEFDYFQKPGSPI